MNSPSVVWLDLADEFVEPSLADARLGLSRTPASSSAFSTDIRAFFRRISVHGFFLETVDSVLCSADSPKLGHLFHRPGEKLVVVSGWNTIRGATPSSHRHILNLVLRRLVDQIPDDEDTTVLWLDSAVPDQNSSAVYSTPSLLPFYPNSPLYGTVTEIVWDLPVAPRSEIWPDDWVLPSSPAAPCYDEIRVIIYQSRDEYDSELYQIPLLIGWSNRFRAESSKYAAVDYKITEPEQSVPDHSARARMKGLALGLLPWLENLYDSTVTSSDSTHKTDITLKKPEDGSASDTSLIGRFILDISSSVGSRGFMPLSSGRINSQRAYRRAPRLRTHGLPSYESEITEPTQPARVSAGCVLSLSELEFNTEVLVCDDPVNLGRTLVGMFTEATRPKEDGFIWTRLEESRLEELLSASADDIMIRQQLFIEDESGIACWEWCPEDSEWTYVGQTEIIGGEGGFLALLRAIRLVQDPLASSEPPRVDFPKRFRLQARETLEKLLEQIRQAKSVTITLVSRADQCEVSFYDSENGDSIHSLAIRSSPDLVNLLRYHAVSGIPLRTSHDMFLSWDLFDDIDYGPLDSLKPLVQTSAPKHVGLSIDSTITGLLNVDIGIITVVLEHDSEACPKGTDENSRHGKCWRLSSPTDEMPYELSNRLLTGREVFGYLSTGRMSLGAVGHSIDLCLAVDTESEEYSAYHEDRWILRLLAQYDVA
jgi:hypothetical protein